MSLILNSVVDVADSLTPSWLKRPLKRFSVDRMTYRLLKKISSSAPRVVRIKSGRLTGRNFTCSLKRERGYWLGTYEHQTQAILGALLHPGDTFIDIGAHKGFMSLIGATFVGENGQVVAFEPNAGNFEALKQNLAMNGDIASRIRAEFIAISDRCGTQKFRGTSGSTMGRIIRDDETADGVYEVPTKTLDSYVDDLRLRPSLLKIDIEGHEETAILGIKSTLMTSRPAALVEVHHENAARAVLSELKTQAYRACSVVGGRIAEYRNFSGREQILCLPNDRQDLVNVIEQALAQ